MVSETDHADMTRGATVRRPPRVSIGFPVYNGEQYIERALRSLLEQTYPDFEIIISDNASTDRTIELIEQIVDGDPRVLLLRNDVNRGAAWNYNRVFEVATGEYFRWQAHDDWCEPDLLQRAVDALDADPGAILAHSWTKVVDAAGETVEWYQNDLHVTSDDPSERLVEIVRRLTYCHPVFGLIRRDVLERTALIAPFPRSDVSLLYELAVLGRFTVIPEFLFSALPSASLRKNPTNQLLAQWFAPDARGKRVPAFWLWRASVAAIWRSPHRVGDKLRATVVFQRVWPVEWARQAVRRRRNKKRGVA